MNFEYMYTLKLGGICSNQKYMFDVMQVTLAIEGSYDVQLSTCCRVGVCVDAVYEWSDMYGGWRFRFHVHMRRGLHRSHLRYRLERTSHCLHKFTLCFQITIPLMIYTYMYI